MFCVQSFPSLQDPGSGTRSPQTFPPTPSGLQTPCAQPSGLHAVPFDLQLQLAGLQQSWVGLHSGLLAHDANTFPGAVAPTSAATAIDNRIAQDRFMVPLRLASALRGAVLTWRRVCSAAPEAVKEKVIR